MKRTSFLLPLVTLISALSASSAALAEPVIAPVDPGTVPMMECIDDDMILNSKLITLNTVISTSDLCPSDFQAGHRVVSLQYTNVFQWDGAQWIWAGETTPFARFLNLDSSIKSSYIYLMSK